MLLTFQIEPTLAYTRIVSFCRKKISELKMNNITPVFIFDGDRLPMKRETERKRKELKDKKKEEAEVLLKENRKEEAMKKMSESIDITPLHAYALIDYLIDAGIEYYVAPYEADAQLAYLYKQREIDAVFTEDSDLLAFGARKVVFNQGAKGTLFINFHYF